MTIHSMLLNATVNELLSKKDFAKSTWHIANRHISDTNAPEKLCFCVTRQIGQDVWFQTWFESDTDRTPQELRSYRTKLDTDAIATKIISDSHYEFERIYDFCTNKTKSQKQKVVKAKDADTEPRFRRRQKQDSNTVSQSTEHLVEPITEADKRAAKLERQLFNNPKMWKFK